MFFCVEYTDTSAIVLSILRLIMIFAVFSGILGCLSLWKDHTKEYWCQKMLGGNANTAMSVDTCIAEALLDIEVWNSIIHSRPIL